MNQPIKFMSKILKSSAVAIPLVCFLGFGNASADQLKAIFSPSADAKLANMAETELNYVLGKASTLFNQKIQQACGLRGSLSWSTAAGHIVGATVRLMSVANGQSTLTAAERNCLQQLDLASDAKLRSLGVVGINILK